MSKKRNITRKKLNNMSIEELKILDKSLDNQLIFTREQSQPFGYKPPASVTETNRDEGCFKHTDCPQFHYCHSGYHDYNGIVINEDSGSSERNCINAADSFIFDDYCATNHCGAGDGDCDSDFEC